MNTEWSQLNKTMQNQINKQASFGEGIATLQALRQQLLKEIFCWKNILQREDFNQMPFVHAKGYHGKTIAYTLWHIFRIEDIVVHSLIRGDEQVFFEGDFQKRINAPLITTGNELVEDEIAAFSKQLNLVELYHYISAVQNATTDVLNNLTFSDAKVKITQEKKAYLQSLHVVSESENAFWLIDYWCGKNVQGLLRMPLSRHWIMHVEAGMRIKDKLHATR